jgi:hypothetical protein
MDSVALSSDEFMASPRAPVSCKHFLQERSFENRLDQFRVLFSSGGSALVQLGHFLLALLEVQ